MDPITCRAFMLHSPQTRSSRFSCFAVLAGRAAIHVRARHSPPSDSCRLCQFLLDNAHWSCIAGWLESSTLGDLSLPACKPSVNTTWQLAFCSDPFPPLDTTSRRQGLQLQDCSWVTLTYITGFCTLAEFDIAYLLSGDWTLFGITMLGHFAEISVIGKIWGMIVADLPKGSILQWERKADKLPSGCGHVGKRSGNEKRVGRGRRSERIGGVSQNKVYQNCYQASQKGSCTDSCQHVPATCSGGNQA